MTFYVYQDITTDDETPRVFYVGKGNEGRLRRKERNQLHGRIAKKHGQFRIVVFAGTEEGCLEEEVRLIEHHKTFAHGGPGYWGANLTRGGEGTSGFRFTEEQKQDRSKKQTERWKDPTERETKHRAALSRWAKPEERQRHSESQKQRFEDPGLRAKISEGTKRGFDNPQSRQRKSETQIAYNSRPEVKQRKSEQMKATRARQKVQSSPSSAPDNAPTDPIAETTLVPADPSKPLLVSLQQD